MDGEIAFLIGGTMPKPRRLQGAERRRWKLKPPGDLPGRSGRHTPSEKTLRCPRQGWDLTAGVENHR